MPVHVAHGLAAGFADYVTQPFKFELWLAALHRALPHVLAPSRPGLSGA